MPRSSRSSSRPRPSGKHAVPSSAPAGERRQNRPLRDALEDLLTHAREIARRAKAMSPAELDYAQSRLEWLADEVWRAATGEATPPE